MSYTFEDATPVKVVGGGKKAGENPFEAVVQSIALKTDDKGKPIAKSFVQPFDDKNDDQKRTTVENRIKRLMSEAGKKSDPVVTVRVDIKDATNNDGKKIANALRVTFWTVTRQERPRPVTQTATTPQSTAPATPAK